DWSNQEGRLQLHDALRHNLEGAYTWKLRFDEDPKLDVHKIVAEMMFNKPEPKDKSSAAYKRWKDKYRRPAKVIYLGKSYCMGKASLAKALKLPTISVRTRSGKMALTSGPEASALIERYEQTFPFLS